jgi:hypothetical protein
MIEVTIHPRCEAIVERRSPGMKHCRAHEEACKVEGARYLIFGDLGSVEQNLCPAHKKAVSKQHPHWQFTELKRAVRKEMREVAEKDRVVARRQYGVVHDDIPRDRDEDIPF